MDQWPSDIMICYTFRDFSQTVVDQLEDHNLITYITFDSSRPENYTFNLSVNSRSVRNFTAYQWHRRAKPKHGRYQLDFIKEATPKISIVLLVSNPLRDRRSLSGAFDCDEDRFWRGACVIVHEIFINNHRIAEERDVYPSCVYKIHSVFKSFVDFNSNFYQMDIKVRLSEYVSYCVMTTEMNRSDPTVLCGSNQPYYSMFETTIYTLVFFTAL